MAQTQFETVVGKTGTGTRLTGISLSGTKELLAAMDGLRGRAEASIPKLLYRIAEQIIGEAKEQTPVQTGNLRASAHVPQPEWFNNWCLVTLGFGGPAGVGNIGRETNKKEVGYAVYVHEGYGSHFKRLSAKEAKKRGTAFGNIGKRKFLEDPMLAWASKIEGKLGADLRAELAGA